MRTRIAALAALLFVLCLAEVAPAEDLYLTLEDGVSVILHSDYTWDYQKGGEVSVHLEKPIELDDGSTLMIRKNGTWGFVVDKTFGKRPTTGLSEVSAVGVSNRTDLSEAKASAMEEALKRLVKQIRAAMPDLKVDDAVLFDCVASEEKDVESTEEMLEIWKATVKLSMDSDGIRNALHCAQSIKKLSPQQ